MANNTNITISPPKELALRSPAVSVEEINSAHAFPDLAAFKDRFYLAFRAAPSHFPSKSSRIHIFSTHGLNDWQSEHSITTDLDIRDPQFLHFNGSLYVFYMSHSMRLFNHEPVSIFYIKKTEFGWSSPVSLPFKHSGFWNIKAKDGTVYISLYTRNGEQNRRVKRHFALFSSNDLQDWQPVFTSPITRERLRSYQTSESTFAFDHHGNIFGTIRSLIYPNLNFSINMEHPSDWSMRVDRFKCDGPRLFEHRGRYYLVARRSEFYRLRAEPFRFFNRWRSLRNVIRYSLSKKRTALYHFDPHTLQIDHIQDLPSHGDTGYSAIARMDQDRFLLVYYSSPINANNDHSWLRGQIAGNTRLYQSQITFS